MNTEKSFLNFFISEWLFSLSLILFIITSVFLKRIPHYTSNEYEVLFILFILFVTVNGIQRHGLSKITLKILKSDSYISAKLIIITFLLSSIITNDIALLLIIPFTMKLKIDKKDLLIILETLAANAGSAFTPIGNPQNLYIYWTYRLNFSQFIQTMLPFSIFFLTVLLTFAFFIKTNKEWFFIEKSPVKKEIYLYFFGLIIIFLIILHILPLFAGLTVLLFPIFKDRESLKIDFLLLIIFFLFFGIADNLAFAIKKQLDNHLDIFLSSTLLSQIISNVPTTTILTNFTSDWKTLLWGVNAGGFGNFIASLANLIAFRIYCKNLKGREIFSFTYKFFMMGYFCLLLSFLIFYLIAH